MKKTCLAGNDCPLSRAYGAVGDWWSLLIVTRVLLGERRRFSEIQEDLGVARNILSARLRKLVEEGILEKVPAPDGSLYQGYAPTEKGRALFKVIVALLQWGETNCRGSPGATSSLVDRRRGRPVPAIEVRAADGRVLGPDDLRLVTPGTVKA
ncbi:MAG: transcriptional regulator [Phycisphaerales bacterium]|nr:transcriptional regulator [Phycisphaerales bacterium]